MCVFEYNVPYQCLCSHQAVLEQPLGHPPLSTCRQHTVTLTTAHKGNGIPSCHGDCLTSLALNVDLCYVRQGFSAEFL